MKKKSLLAGLMLVAALGLTACGNPLKSLPEVSDENLVESYDDDKETYGNAAVDRLVKQFKKDDILKGDITSLVVYDREDNEESKEKSELSVELQCETDIADYTEYYVVTMKYDSENKEWKVKETEPDKKEDKEVKVKYEISDEKASSILKDYIYSVSKDNYYINLSDGDITDISIDDPEAEVVDGSVTVRYPVDVTVNYYNYIYELSATLVCNVYTETDSYRYGYELESFKNDSIYYYSYEDLAVNSAELDPEVEKLLSEDIMFEAAIDDFDALYTYYYTFDVTADDIVSYTTTDFTISSSSAQRNLAADVKITDGITEQYYMNITYYYSDADGWYYSYLYDGHNYDDNGNYYVDIDNSFKGSYTGEVSVGKDDVGEISINVTGIDGTTLTGDAEFGGSTVDFTATYDAYSHYISFDFDEDIKFKKHYSYDYLTLYYDKETDSWRTTDYASLQMQLSK